MQEPATAEYENITISYWGGGGRGYHECINYLLFIHPILITTVTNVVIIIIR